MTPVFRLLIQYMCGKVRKVPEVFELEEMSVKYICVVTAILFCRSWEAPYSTVIK